MSANVDPASPAPTPRQGIKLWKVALWLIPLGLLAIIIGLNVYNARWTLTPERLAAAQERWRAANVKDYDLLVTVAGSTSGTYRLQVRGGKVAEATQNGAPFASLRLASDWTVDGLFDVVLANDLANDARAGNSSSFTRARFDEHDGHLTWYQRDHGHQRVQMTVALTHPDKQP